MDEIRLEGGRFLLGDAARPLAELSFHRTGTRTIVIDHTFVDDSLKGQGWGQRLVAAAAGLARAEGAVILPLCPFARKVMARDEAYKDLLAEE
jgi:predicted GNAT family acetyltransferase